MVLHLSGHIPLVQANKLLKNVRWRRLWCKYMLCYNLKGYSAFETFSGLINIQLQ